MQFTSEQRLDDGVLEREFTLGEIPGTLWTPGSAPVPLVLMAHNNGLPRAEPRLVARARYTAARGYAVATIDAAGCGDRPRSAADEQARADLRRAMQAGEPVDEIFESFIGPLVENAVPEWRTTLDALLELPEIGGPVGYSGGWTVLGIRLAVLEPRIAAAASTGPVVDTRARFGFTAAPGTTDDARLRHLTLALPPPYAARLFDAQDTGATERRLRDIAAEGLGEVYFRDGGRRAHGLEVEFTDVEHLEVEL